MKLVVRRTYVVVALLCAAAVIGGSVLYWTRQRAFATAIARLRVDAQARLQAGNKAEAESLLEAYLQFRPGDRDAKRQYAMLLLERVGDAGTRRRDKVQACITLEAVLRETPDDAPLRLELAKLQMSIRDYTSALEHLSRLRQSSDAGGAQAADHVPRPDGAASPAGDTWSLDLMLADALAATGRFREAIDLLGGLVNFDAATRTFRELRSPSAPAAAAGVPPHPGPDTTDAYLKLASLLQDETSDLDAASLVLEQAARQNPGSARIWMILAIFRAWHLKDGPGASEALAKATAIAPDDSQVLHGNFQKCLLENQPALAAGFVARGRELHPQAEWVYAAEATLALRDADAIRAIDSLLAGIAVLGARPSLLQSLVDLPDTAQAMAGLTARMTMLEETLPADDVYLAVLNARCLMAAGKSWDAKRRLDTARPLAAQSRALVASIDMALGRCHQRLGEPDLQIAAYRRALSINPAFIEAHAGVATALLECGQDDAALAELRDVASRLTTDDLAARPELWRPLVRLESTAVRALPAGKTDWSAVDTRVRTLEASPALGRSGAAMLRAEDLAARGRPDDAIAVLDEAAAAAPADVPVQCARLVAHARSRGFEEFRTLVDSLPADVRDAPTLLRAELVAAADFPPSVVSGLVADVEVRGAGLTSDDDALAILEQLVLLASSTGRRDDASRIARRMIERCPDAPRGPLALCSTGLARNDIDEVRESAALLSAIVGAAAMETRYAAAAVRVLELRRDLEERQDKEPRARPDKGEMREIRNTLKELGAQRPHWPDVAALEAECDLLEGNTAAAIAAYAKAAAERPRDVVIARTLIALLMRSRRFADAERTLAALDPTGRDRVGRFAAELALRAGKPGEATAIAGRTVAAEIRDVDDLLWCAGVLREQGRGAESEAALVLATRSTPQRIEPWLELLDRQAARDAVDRIEETLTRGMAAVAAVQRPLLRAEADRLLGRRDVAASGFRQVVAAEDGSAVALRYAARGLMLNGQSDEARAALDALVGRQAASDPDVQARAWARRELVKMTTDGAAYPTLMRGIDMLKRNATAAWTNSPEDATLAVSLLAERAEPQCWRRAVDVLDQLDAKQLLTVDQSVLRARLRDRLGDWEKCRLELLALATKPDMPATVYATLVRLLVEHDDASAAEPWLRTLVSLAPEAAETIALQSRILLAKEDRPAAVQQARRLMPAPDSAVDAPELIARASLLEDLGFRKAADVLLKRAAEQSVEGAAARVAALTRWGMANDALDVVASAWDGLPLEESLRMVSRLIETRGPALDATTLGRVSALAEKAGGTSPDSAELAILRAELCIASGEEAEVLLRKALDREGLSTGQQVRIVATLTSCLARGNGVTEANDLIDSAIREIGPLPELLDARGIARMARGDTAKAVEDFREACLAPSPHRLLHLAFALSELGDLDGAREALAQAPREAIAEESLAEPDKRWLESIAHRLSPASSE